MDAWAELKIVLARLRAEQPGAVLGYPDPSADTGPPPPFTIVLAPWAAATARDLYERFGDRVDLTVGALPYPPGRMPSQPPAVRRLERISAPRLPVELLNPAEVRVDLAGPGRGPLRAHAAARPAAAQPHRRGARGRHQRPGHSDRRRSGQR